jgi:fatty-acyl-CoA synthase
VIVQRRLSSAVALARSVLVPFERPDRLPRALLAARPWGRGLAGLAAAAAARYPSTVALIDDDGPVTYAELWNGAHTVADALRATGAGPGAAVGVLCRNHRGFVVGCLATAISGADLVLLNPGFAAPQLADVVAAEGVHVVVHDDDLTEVVEGCGAGHLVGEATMTLLASNAARSTTRVAPPDSEGRVILLTSGTTGRPKGAARRTDSSAVDAVAGLLMRIPLRARDTQVVPAPLFHAWGFSHLLLGMSRSATTVVARRFDPAGTLDLVERHRARVLVAVPVMLQRILALGDDEHRAHDLTSLDVVAASGSALSSHLATEWIRQIGPNLYNTYGSTEVALASIATPDELRRHPTTAGRVVPGVRVEILDAEANPVPVGTVGRIFVANAGRFEGYTSGGSKESVGDLLSSGDLGHFDAEGLLYVDGRDDDMVVSGGENVFPVEVEDLLLAHPSIADAAVVGVPDDDFGQVLAAHIVLRPGHALTGDEVRAHVRGHLARFKVPRHVRFVEELPRTSSGKILHRDLGSG